MRRDGERGLDAKKILNTGNLAQQSRNQKNRNISRQAYPDSKGRKGRERKS
jgi:hypothetical protein